MSRRGAMHNANARRKRMYNNSLPLLCMLACLMLCVAGSSVAVLPCGTRQLLTPQNATNMTLVVPNCWQNETTEVLLRGGADGARIDNMTLLVSHSVHLRVVIDGMRLVNSLLSFVNVTYPSNCSVCAAGAAVRVRNASIEGSTVAVSGALMSENYTALLLIEASNVTRSSLALRSSSTAATAASIESSVFVDSNLTLQGVAARTQMRTAPVSLFATTFMRSHVAAVNCTFQVNSTSADQGGSTTPAVAVDNCSLHHTALVLQNVSAFVQGLDASSTSLQRLLSVERSTVMASSVTLTDVDSASVGMFGTNRSVWAANSSVVLDVFRLKSLVAAMPCAAVFEASTLHGAMVMLSAGAVSMQGSGVAEVLCVAGCHVERTVLLVSWLMIEQRHPGVAAGARGVFSVVNSTLSSAALHVSDIRISSTSATALVLSRVLTADSNLTLTSMVLAGRHGISLLTSNLYTAQLLLTASIMSSSQAAVHILDCRAVDFVASLTNVTIMSQEASALVINASNVTACSIVVQRSTLIAAAYSFCIDRTALIATIVALADSNVSAATLVSWFLASSNVTSGSIVVQRSTLRAASHAFVVQLTMLIATIVMVENSNVSATTSVAWLLVSSSVADSSIAVERSWLSAASNTFFVDHTALVATIVTLVDSNVSATTLTAWFLASSNVADSSIAVERSWLSAVSNAMQVQSTALIAVNVTLVDSNVSAAASVAWFLTSSNVVDSSIVVAGSTLSAASHAFVVQLAMLTATIVLLADSNVSSTTLFTLMLVSLNVTAGDITLQRTWLSAASYTFQVDQTVLTAVHVALVNCTVSAVSSNAWFMTSSNVTAGSIEVRHCWLSTTTYSFAVYRTMLNAVHVTLVDSSLSAAAVALILASSNVTACNITLHRTFLGTAGNTFQVQQTVLTAVHLALLDCTLSAVASVAWFLTSSKMTACNVILQSSWLSAASDAFRVREAAFSATNVTLLDSNVSAATSWAWNLIATNVTACSIKLQRMRLSAESNAFVVEHSTLNATNVSLLDSAVFAVLSVAWQLLSSNLTNCHIAIQRTWLRTESIGFLVSQTKMYRVNMTLLDSNVSVAASWAWQLFSSNLTSCHIAIQRAWLSGVSNTFLVSQSALTAATMTVLESIVSAAESRAWLLLLSTVTDCRIEVQRTQLSGANDTFRVSLTTLTATNVTLLDSNVSAATSAACIMWSSTVSTSSIVVRRTWVSALRSAFQLEQTVLTATNLTVEDSNVSATTSAAWFLVLSNITASNIVLQRTWLSAASSTCILQRVVLEATNVTLVDSNVSAAVSTAWFLISSNVTASNMAVQRTWLSAASNTLQVEQVTMTATTLTLVDSNVSAAASGACVVSSSNLAAANVVLLRTSVSAPRNTFVVQQSTLTATNVTLVDSNVSATTSVAWYVWSSTVSASSIVVRRTWVSALRSAFQLEQTVLTATNLTVEDSNVSATTSAAWFLVLSNITASNIVLQRTWLSAASSTCILQRVVLEATNVTLADSNVSAATSAACSLVLCNVTTSSIHLQRLFLVGVGADFSLRDTALTGSYLTLRECSLACAPARGDDLSAIAVMRVASSTITRSSLLLQLCSVYAEGGSVVRVVHTTVAAWRVHVVGLSSRRDAKVINQSPPCRDGSAAAMVAIEQSHTADVDFVFRSSTVDGICTLLLCNDSRVELETLAIAESNISTTHDDPFAPAPLVGAVGSGTTYIHNVTVERSRFAGFTEVFGASGAFSLSVGDSSYRCSWWTFTAATPRWRPLTKLHLGIATFERLPAFGSGGSDGDASAACGVVTVSVSESATASPLELSGSRSMLLSSSETLALTASGGTASCSRSGTTTADATPTPIVAQRVVRVLVVANVGSAALIGAAIATTSFSAVRSGLTGQRVAFVLRSAGRKCAALDDDSTAVEVDGVDWLSSPTRLSVGSGAAAAHRGAVLGNIAVCAGAALLSAVVVGAAVLGRGLRATAAMSAIHVRHVLCVPVMLLLEPTMASSVTLLVDAAGAAADVAVGGAGVVCVGSALLAVARVLDPRTSRFRARAEAMPRVPLASRAWRWWTAACVVWRPKAGSGRFVLDWGFLFDDSRGERHWWALVDMGVAVAMGGLSSAAPATSSSCAVWKWAIVAVACGGVVLPLVLVPLSSARAMCECVTMAVLTALIAVLAAVDAGDAEVEGIGILAAVLQWALLLLRVVELRIHTRSENNGVVQVVDVAGVEASRVIPSDSSAHGNGARMSLAHPNERISDVASWQVVLNRRSALRAQTRSRRQAAALQALVKLICCHQRQEVLSSN